MQLAVKSVDFPLLVPQSLVALTHGVDKHLLCLHKLLQHHGIGGSVRSRGVG